MDKVIFWEKDSVKSDKNDSSNDGVYFPWLRVWPLYDGFCKSENNVGDYYSMDGGGDVHSIDEEWAFIISATFERYMKQRELCVVCYSYQEKSQSWWGRTILPAGYKLTGNATLDENYIAICESHWAGKNVFLLLKQADQFGIPAFISVDTFDYVSLLSHGEAIVIFGVEEPVLQMLFLMDDPLFLEILGRESQRYGHACQESGQSFVSHWDMVNGSDWRKPKDV